jgi:uncharacterized membrane protein HdeD (DUF308 family)
LEGEVAEQMKHDWRGQNQDWDIPRAALGALLILAGLFVLIDISLVATISAVLIGATALIAGVVIVVHGLRGQSWSGLLVGLAIGSLYVFFGALLINNVWFRVTFLTLALSGTLINSGILRLLFGLFRWSTYRWLALSGVIAIGGGTIILLPTPITDLRFIALILGIDFLVHGLIWILMARGVREPVVTL